MVFSTYDAERKLVDSTEGRFERAKPTFEAALCWLSGMVLNILVSGCALHCSWVGAYPGSWHRTWHKKLYFKLMEQQPATRRS